jgi:hypothetical protein
MNTEDQNVTAKILSDIKLIRESFTRPTTDSLRSLTEMSQRIATGAYLVTQHMSDKVSIKMSVRSSADALVGVVYESGEDSMSSHIHNVVSATEKLMSYISIARTVGAISDINGLLIEREALKLTRLGSMMLVRGDAGFVENLARERSDVRLKISELFDVSEIDIKRTRTKQVEKITRVEQVSDSVHVENQIESIGHSQDEKGHSHNQPQYSHLNDSTVDHEVLNAPSEDLGVVGDSGVQRGGAQPQEVVNSNTASGAAAHTPPVDTFRTDSYTRAQLSLTSIHMFKSFPVLQCLRSIL